MVQYGQEGKNLPPSPQRKAAPAGMGGAGKDLSLERASSRPSGSSESQKTEGRDRGIMSAEA